jgi:hypothetical protein
LKRYFSQRIMPAAIDAAGGAESVVERVAEQTRRRPSLVLGCALVCGFLLPVLLLGRRRPMAGKSGS